MLHQGRRKKKRKSSGELVPVTEPIEALQRFKELHASWPSDVKMLLSEDLEQVVSSSVNCIYRKTTYVTYGM
jgi:hypothetical protein